MIYGIDLGPAAGAVEWALLKEKGIAFAVIKATQGDYRVNPALEDLAAGAKAAGMLVGLYHWCDPLCNAQAQADYFLRKTDGLNFEFAALDFEQYWADWAEWPKNIRKRLAPESISRCGQLTAAAIRSGLRYRGYPAADRKKVLIYTRASFVHDYALPALQWLSDFPLWIAHWAYTPGQMTLSWEELLAMPEHHALQPALPKGLKNWVLHQWSGDRFLLPGLGGQKADLNRFSGSLHDLAAWLGIPQPQGKETVLGMLKQQVDSLHQQAGQVVVSLQAYLESCDAAADPGIYPSVAQAEMEHPCEYPNA